MIFDIFRYFYTHIRLAFLRRKLYYYVMFKILRIVFCLLSVACTAVTIFIFISFGLWGLLPLGGALAFAALMFICKNAQESKERKLNPPAPEGDFITGKVKKENTDEK